MEVEFSWGLGRKSNTQAEMYGFLQGLSIAKDKGLEDIISLGYSLLTIQYLNSENNSKDNSLTLVL